MTRNPTDDTELTLAEAPEVRRAARGATSM
jgi:hypothetical protein